MKTMMHRREDASVPDGKRRGGAGDVGGEHDAAALTTMLRSSDAASVSTRRRATPGR